MFSGFSAGINKESKILFSYLFSPLFNNDSPGNLGASILTTVINPGNAFLRLFKMARALSDIASVGLQ